MLVAAPPPKTARPAKIFAVVNCCWLLVLGLLFFAYWNEYVLFSQLAGLNVVRQLQGHDPIGGIIPSYVLWAGALGGVTISLLGCVRYGRSWDPRLNVWHALRPVLGAIAASVGFVILVLVLKAAAGTQFATDEIPTNPASQGLFFIIAFILGFREGLFLELVQKIAKMILTTGTASAKIAFELDRDKIEFGQVPVGSEEDALVTVTLTEPDTATKLSIDSCRIVGGGPFRANLLPASSSTPLVRTIDVIFAPTATETFSDQLEVVVGGMTSLVDLTGDGSRPLALASTERRKAITRGNGDGKGKPPTKPKPKPRS